MIGSLLSILNARPSLMTITPAHIPLRKSLNLEIIVGVDLIGEIRNLQLMFDLLLRPN